MSIKILRPEAFAKVLREAQTKAQGEKLLNEGIVEMTGRVVEVCARKAKIDPHAPPSKELATYNGVWCRVFAVLVKEMADRLNPTELADAMEVVVRLTETM